MEITAIKCPQCGASSQDDIKIINADNTMIGRCAHCKTKFIINDLKKITPIEEEKPKEEEKPREVKAEKNDVLDFEKYSKNVREIFYLLITDSLNYHRKWSGTTEEVEKYLEKIDREFRSKVLGRIPELTEAEKKELLSAATRRYEQVKIAYDGQYMISETIDCINKSLVAEEKEEIEFQDNKCSSMKSSNIKRRIMALAAGITLGLTSYNGIKAVMDHRNASNANGVNTKIESRIVFDDNLTEEEKMEVIHQIVDHINDDLIKGRISEQEAVSKLEGLGIDVDPNYIDEIHLISQEMKANERGKLIAYIDGYCEKNNVSEETKALLKSEDTLSFLSSITDERQKEEVIATLRFGFDNGDVLEYLKSAPTNEETNYQKPMSKGV